MGINNIANVVNSIIKDFKTNNPFELCEKLDVTIKFKNYNPEGMKAYYTDVFGEKTIYLNSNFTEESQAILCAHELGHIILEHKGINHFDSSDSKLEHEANIFALYLLFDENKYDIKFSSTNSYLARGIIESKLSLIK
ncbi:ImmA/IrrE family metallo-endopeptidase [Clostridioides difficile]